jgi:sulfate adenylyltransferase subunit 2
MPLRPGEIPQQRLVRFRTLGCYPLTGAIESAASSIPEILSELGEARVSERRGRSIDRDSQSSMERKKRDGYF